MYARLARFEGSDVSKLDEQIEELQGPDGQIRLQWCWGGAPGIVAAAADYLDEELLLAGAELTWRAGPHRDEKGPGICHGTAGNGYAFLKAFERTGDELWLERARRFAVHALGQVARLREERGRAATPSGRETPALRSTPRTAWTGEATIPSSTSTP